MQYVFRHAWDSDTATHLELLQYQDSFFSSGGKTNKQLKHELVSVQFHCRTAQDGAPQPGSGVTLSQLSQLHTLPLGPLTFFPFCLQGRISSLEQGGHVLNSGSWLRPGHRAAPKFPTVPGEGAPGLQLLPSPPPARFPGETPRPPRRLDRAWAGGGLSPHHKQPSPPARCLPTAPAQRGPPYTSGAAAPGDGQPR